METKYFQSKYNETHRECWKDIISELGVRVYDVIVPCELAVILGGYFENPSAFTDKVSLVFYKTDIEDDGSRSYKENYEMWELFEKRKYVVWSDLLHKYFDEVVDITGLDASAAARKIRRVVESYQS